MDHFSLHFWPVYKKGGMVIDKKVHILGFAGSLRKQSYNRAILAAALEIVPDDASLEIFDLEGIPSFNQDLELQPPDKVIRSKSSKRKSELPMLS
jgi:chromate reductase